MPELSLPLWAAAFAIAVLAGFVKGAVGFALPMIMISGLGSFLAAETAIAALLFSTLVTNVFQSFRQGLAAALASARKHWRFAVMVMVVIAFSAQLVALLPGETLFLVIGIPVTIFALVQLAGVRLHISERRRRLAEILFGGFAGFVGGLAGVWGPPTVLYLTALETPKVEQIRVQGIVYGTSSVVLTLAHVRSGVLNADTAPLSALLLVPALAGLWLGVMVQDRLDQMRFRRFTLLVLALAGLNLVRRGVIG